MSLVLRDELKRIFGYEKFYSDEQEKVTLAVWKGTSDVYINLHPGGGKSLCFQLPTLLKPRSVTVVFVPTHKLFLDHMNILNRHGIEAEYIHSRMPKKQYQSLLDSLGTDRMKFRFLYASTDKPTGKMVKKIINKLNNVNALAYIVFDEAHCISKLSHDYVSTYNDLAKLMKDVCPNIKKIALTGTSTVEVKVDLIETLRMKNPRSFKSRSDYHNVFHDVQFMDTMREDQSDPIKNLKSFIERVTRDEHNPTAMDSTKRGIIFCREKKTTDTVVKSLMAENKYFPPESVVAYHGGMTLKDRMSIHEKWLAGEINVIVTTRQSGISLYARTINFTVHWSMPTSIQQLFRETGRVNRDGTQLFCRLYFSCAEETAIMTQIKSELKRSPDEVEAVARKLRFFQDIIDYCLQVKCRRVAQWAYFERMVKDCGNSCDVCQDRAVQRARVQKFFNYRVSVINNMVDNIELSPRHEIKAYLIKPPTKSDNDFLVDFIKLEIEALKQRWKKKLRERQCKKLQGLLLENYKCGKREAGNKLEKDDIHEVGRQLEYSVYMGTKPSKNYRHDIHRKIQIIQSYTDSGLICSYLMFSQTQPLKNPEVKIEVVDLVGSDDPAKSSTKDAYGSKRKRVDEIIKTVATTGMHEKSRGKGSVKDSVNYAHVPKKRRIFENPEKKDIKSLIVCVDLVSDSD